MIVYIKLLDKTKHELEIDENSRIINIKNIIYDKLKIDILTQRLSYNGITLSDDCSINECNIIINSIIHLLYQIY